MYVVDLTICVLKFAQLILWDNKQGIIHTKNKSSLPVNDNISNCQLIISKLTHKHWTTLIKQHLWHIYNWQLITHINIAAFTQSINFSSMQQLLKSGVWLQPNHIAFYRLQLQLSVTISQSRLAYMQHTWLVCLCYVCSTWCISVKQG